MIISNRCLKDALKIIPTHTIRFSDAISTIFRYLLYLFFRLKVFSSDLGQQKAGRGVAAGFHDSRENPTLRHGYNRISTFQHLVSKAG